MIMDKTPDYNAFNSEPDSVLASPESIKGQDADNEQGSEENSFNPFTGNYNYPLKKASFKEVEYVRK